MNISFYLTRAQVLAQTKFVTRRVGWADLKPGTVLQGVEKGQGLKKGEKVVPLCQIRVLDVRRERLDEIVRPGTYGAEEMILEGFPGMDPQDFLFKFVASHDCDPDSVITRIRFDYLSAKRELSRTVLNPKAAWPFPKDLPRG
jgi:hypothetical protein